MTQFSVTLQRETVYGVLLLIAGTYRVAKQGTVFHLDDVGTWHVNINPVCFVSLSLRGNAVKHFALYDTFLNTFTMNPIKVNLDFLTEYSESRFLLFYTKQKNS
jgi:hypothetical protein